MKLNKQSKNIPKKVSQKQYEKNRLNKSLNGITEEGIFISASGNMTSNYITPYALHLGASNGQVGFVHALQSLASTFAQLPAARLPGMINRKMVWSLSIIGSRLIWIPIILLVFFPFEPVLALTVLLAVYSFLNAIRGPAWASLVGDIVPPDKRGEYFGKRNMLVGLAGLFSMLTSGLILAIFGFGILFGLSVIIGLVALWSVSKIFEPPMAMEFHYRHSIKFNLRSMIIGLKLNKNLMYFTAYIMIVSFAIAMAAPFYAVYMLKNLGLDYITYSIVITIGVLVTIFSQPYWGKMADRYGERSILIITALMIPFIPLFWIFASTPVHLVLIQIYDGFIFGGWSLVIFNFLLASTPADKRTNYIANHTFFVGLTTFAGTLIGGLIADKLQLSPMFGFGGLTILFLISFILRIISWLFLPQLHSTYSKKITPEPLEHLAWRVILVEPAKSISHSLSHIYDVNWLWEKIKSFFVAMKYKIIIRQNG